MYDPTTEKQVIEHKKPVISPAYLLPDPDNAVEMAETQAYVEFVSLYTRPEQDPSEPLSDAYYPILEDDRIVAMVGNAFRWYVESRPSSSFHDKLSLTYTLVFFN